MRVSIRPCLALAARSCATVRWVSGNVSRSSLSCPAASGNAGFFGSGNGRGGCSGTDPPHERPPYGEARWRHGMLTRLAHSPVSFEQASPPVGGHGSYQVDTLLTTPFSYTLSRTSRTNSEMAL